MNLGQLLLNGAIYGYVLSEASNLISDGSEYLLLVPRLAPIVGSIVLPVLGAVPDGLMVMFSGLGNDAQNQVSVGVGALAGSSIMLLTLPWFVAVYFGRVNIKGGECTYRAPKGQSDGFEKITQRESLMETLRETGVGIGAELHQNAWIMLYSMFGYFIVQIPALYYDKTKPADIATGLLKSDQKREAGNERWFAFLGFIVCFIEFCLYLKAMWDGSADEGGLVEDKIAQQHVKAMQGGTLTLQGAIAQFRNESGFASMLDEGTGDVTEHLKDEAKQVKVRRMCQILAPFFAVYDINGDNSIDFDEFRMIFKDMRGNMSRNTLRGIFKAADINGGGDLDFEEFAACIMSFAFYPDGMPDASLQDKQNKIKSPSVSVALDMVTGGEDEDEAGKKDEEDDEDEEEEEEDMPEEFQNLDPEEQLKRILLRSFSMMMLGTVLVVVFSDPIVDVFYQMGLQMNINPFYVSFVLAPMASNACELVAAYNYAKRRTQKSITTALSCLEGAAVMNNTFVLGIFYALVYFKGLAWEFTAETFSIVLIESMIGVMVLRVRSQSLLDACIIVSFYFLAMAVVYVLEAMGID